MNAIKSLFPIIFLAFLLMVSGCNKSDDNSQDVSSKNFNVSGRLIANGLPVAGASVDIDGLVQYTATTDQEGRFVIEKVSDGEHSLNTVKDYGNGIYIRRSFDLDVNENLELTNLLLPNPVSITSIILDTATNMATVSWNSSDASDFREYKLYSHYSSGLDETTGTLEHVATNPGDTVKSVQLSNLSETFFRVFVMNDYGQLGGSNIMSINSINLNLLPGGDFEDPTLFWDHWSITQGSVNIIDTISYHGNNCLYMQNTIIPDEWVVEESLIEVPLVFEKDVEYKLSFWYKISGVARMDYHTLYFYYYQEEEAHLETNLSFELPYNYWPGEWIPNGPFKILQETDWLYYSKTFVPTSDSPARFYIGGQIEHILLDDMQIKVSEQAH